MSPKLKKTAASKQQIHALADKLNISWDNNRTFMSWTKGITGKAHLDDMTKEELSSVYSALKKRGKEKTATVVGHISGPSGSGKTTLLGKLQKKYPTLTTKDLDEFDEKARQQLGPKYVAKKSTYTDGMLSRLYTRRQELLDNFLREKKDSSVVLGGHHIEGPHALKFQTERKLLLNTGARKSALRRSKRGNKPGTDNIPKYRQEAKGTITELKASGYKKKSKRKITRAIKKTAAKTTVKEHSRKGRSGRLTKVKAHQREYAKGLPDKKYFARIPKVSRPETWEYVVQEHLANRAGKHFDLRLAKDKKAHSWVIRRLPGPGEKVLAIHQPTHTREYMDWEGVIPKGYGAGKVSRFGRGQVEVVEANENKVIFNKYDGKKANEYILIRTDAKNWLLMNRTTTEGKYEYPRHKDKYKSARFSDSLVYQEGIMQPKVDGAHALVVLHPGKRPRVFSYRTSKKGDVLEYTHKIPGLFAEKVPYGTKAAVLRAEVFMTDKGGKALPAERTAAVLNSGIERARELQKGTGGLKVLPFDVASSKEIRGWASKDIDYGRRLDIVKGLASAMPFLLTPDLAVDAKSKRRMMEQVRSGKHPLTSEGVVTWSDEGPTKAKVTNDADVYVRRVFEGEGKYKGSAGGFYYSRSPNGPIIGKVGSGLSDTARRELWDKKSDMGGKVAIIKYDKETARGALFAPRFKGWHVDKNIGNLKKTAAKKALTSEGRKALIEKLKRALLPPGSSDRAALAAAAVAPMPGALPLTYSAIALKNAKPAIKGKFPSFWGAEEWATKAKLASPKQSFEERKKFIDNLTERIKAKGSKGYGAHKRIAIAKEEFKLKRMKRMGFKTSFTGVPEPGQTKFRSWRGPKGLHAHDHGSHWVMHKDEHDPRKASLKSLVKHVKGEGMPAVKYLRKWKKDKKPDVLDTIQSVKEVAKNKVKKTKEKTAKKDNIEIGPAPLIGGGLAFLGVIGKDKPLAGKGKSFRTFENFSKGIKPGDILMTGQAVGHNAPNTNKFWISAGTGTPTATHVAIVEKVLPDGRVQTIDFTARGGYNRIIYDRSALDPRDGKKQILTALRPKDPQVAGNALLNYKRKLDAFQGLEKELTLRGVPQQKAKDMMSATFTGGTRGTAVAFRELFLPYFKNTKKQVVAQQAQHAEALKMLEQSIPETADRMAKRWTGGESVKAIARTEIPRCLGGMCSTSLAAAGAPITGKSSVPYFTTPGDVLRSSGTLDPIGRYNPATPGINKLVNPALRYAPNISRAVVGGGLIAAPIAAGIYGYKKLKQMKEERAAMPKTAAGDKLETARKKDRELTRLQKSLLGGSLIGATAGAATGLKDYHMKKEYYKEVAKEIRDPLKKIPIVGERASKAIPKWDSFGKRVRAGSIRAGKGIGLISGLGGAATIYALDKLKEKDQERTKKLLAKQKKKTASKSATKIQEVIAAKETKNQALLDKLTLQ